MIEAKPVRPIPATLISWQEFYSLSRELSYAIGRSGFLPDLIVGVGRGGYMPARVLADFLGVLNLAAVKVEHYRGTRKEEGARLRYSLNPEVVAGDRILIVDDVSDTGESFKLTLAHVKQRFPDAETRTASMHYKNGSLFIPDFFVERVREWRWIVYPWALIEDVSSFMEDIDHQGQSTVELVAQLEQRHGVRIDPRVVEDVLAMAELRRKAR